MDSPDFLALAASALASTQKTDRSAWPPQLMQYGLYEPKFFAAAAAKCTPIAAPPSDNEQSAPLALDDERLAALLKYCGLRVLQQEATANAKSGNFPLHAGAMLLSFPQRYKLPDKHPDGSYDWRAPDQSHALSSYWQRLFPGLEEQVIARMSQSQLLQRKAGAPQLYVSLTSCYHTAQFRRIAALSLITQEEADRHITGELPRFDIKWGDSLRTHTEYPLFVALIAQFYAAVYDALDPTLLAEPLALVDVNGFNVDDLLAPELTEPSLSAPLPTKPPLGPPPPRDYSAGWSTPARWIGLFVFAWLPTLLNAVAGNLSFLQLVFGSFATNTCGAILTNAIIGYTRRTLSENGEDYHFATRTLSLIGGVLIIIVAVFWSAQENLKWLTSNTYLSSLTNTAFLTVVIYLSMLNLAVLVSYGLRLVFGHMNGAKHVALRYPKLFGTGLILFCAADILPEVLLKGAHLNYSPTAAAVVAYGAMFVPLFLLFCVLLGNQVIMGRFQMPRGWPVALIHFLAGIGIFLAEQYTPTESVNVLVLIGGFLVILGVFIPAIWAARRNE